MTEQQFAIVYDGECPFCRVEAKWLTMLDCSGRLLMVDITAPEFDPSQYGTTLPALMGTLHGFFADGRQTQGLDTFRQAYNAVGLGWLLAPTGWPVLRPFFDSLYTLFARYRVRLGRVFGRGCSSGRCWGSAAKKGQTETHLISE